LACAHKSLGTVERFGAAVRRFVATPLLLFFTAARAEARGGMAGFLAATGALAFVLFAIE
jgi:hypothetical protein